MMCKEAAMDRVTLRVTGMVVGDTGRGNGGKRT